jgi:hypothetical protein
MAVVPMIAIQFGVYELLQKQFERLNLENRISEAAKNRARQFRTSVAKARERRLAKKILLGVPHINRMFKESESKANIIDEVSEKEVLSRHRNQKIQSDSTSTLQSASTVILRRSTTSSGSSSSSGDKRDFLQESSATSMDQDIYIEEKLVSWIESKLNDLKVYQPRFSFKQPSLSLVVPSMGGGLFPSSLGNVVGPRL